MILSLLPVVQVPRRSIPLPGWLTPASCPAALSPLHQHDLPLRALCAWALSWAELSLAPHPHAVQGPLEGPGRGMMPGGRAAG